MNPILQRLKALHREQKRILTAHLKGVQVAICSPESDVLQSCAAYAVQHARKRVADVPVEAIPAEQGAAQVVAFQLTPFASILQSHGLVVPAGGFETNVQYLTAVYAAENTNIFYLAAHVCDAEGRPAYLSEADPCETLVVLSACIQSDAGFIDECRRLREEPQPQDEEAQQGEITSSDLQAMHTETTV